MLAVIVLDKALSFCLFFFRKLVQFLWSFAAIWLDFCNNKFVWIRWRFVILLGQEGLKPMRTTFGINFYFDWKEMYFDERFKRCLFVFWKHSLSSLLKSHKITRKSIIIHRQYFDSNFQLCRLFVHHHNRHHQSLEKNEKILLLIIIIHSKMRGSPKRGNWWMKWKIISINWVSLNWIYG